MEALTDYLGAFGQEGAPVASRAETPTYPVPWYDGRVASWVATVDHKRIGILYIATASSSSSPAGAGAADPHAARAAGHGLHRARHLQPALHDARHDDGLPRRRPDLRRLRELPRPADDRRARHGLPAAERALVLALPLRRDRAPRASSPPTARRARAGRLPAAVGRLSGNGQDLWIVGLHVLTLSSLAGAINFLVTIHNMRTAGMTWMRLPLFVWTIEIYSALLVLVLPALSAGLTHAAARPAGRDALLHPGRGRRRRPLPARLLVLRPPRGLHHDPAGDGDHLRGDPRLRAQADLRLQGDRVLDRRDRLLLAARLGAPHVHGRPADLAPDLLHDRVDDHRRPDGREDLQLARDDLAREPALRHGDAVRARLHRRVHDRRPLRDLRRRLPVRLAGARHLLRRRPPALRALRRVGLRHLRGALLLVAEDVRPDARRDAREVALLAGLRRLQPRRSSRSTCSACSGCRGASTPTATTDSGRPTT